MDFLYADMTQASFWVAVFQIIVVNIILSGDNAVVIALAGRLREDQGHLSVVTLLDDQALLGLLQVFVVSE